MSKTLVSINILDNVNAQAYSSHCQEWFRLGRTTKDDFVLFTPNRYSIDNARNQAAKYALQTECDYLYFIDDDIVLTPNTYQALKNDIETHGFDIAQALTIIRGYPFHPMMFRKKIMLFGNNNQLDYFDDYKNYIDENKLVECDAVGFSAVLIKCNLLNRINPPYFVTGAELTEDIYFCLKLKDKLSNTVRFCTDTFVPTAHLMLPEAVSAANREHLKEHYKPLSLKENGADRGEEYRERCLTQFNLFAK